MKKLIALSVNAIPNSVLNLHPSMDVFFTVLFAAIYRTGFVGLFVLLLGKVGGLLGLFVAVVLFAGGGDGSTIDDDQRGGLL